MTYPPTTRSIYTQGMNANWAYDGSYAPMGRGRMTFEQFVAGIDSLPTPPAGYKDCPPTIGINTSPVCPNVCRIDTGMLVIFPMLLGHSESRQAPPSEVKTWAQSVWNASAMVEWG